MREDSALSHLKDGESCVVLFKNGEKRKVRWSVPEWSFIAITDDERRCRFEDIKEWMPASIKHHL
ncbi:hypothetical protein [Noviherbaspirillum sp.]|uniref:hypothetical protein n=1 Tax=Noviherbaspirillum sp. TaxID=1926288 RepID=UPI002FDF8621